MKKDNIWGSFLGYWERSYS